MSLYSTMSRRMGGLVAASVGAASLPNLQSLSDATGSRSGGTPSAARHLWWPFALPKAIECNANSAAFMNCTQPKTQRMVELEKSIDLQAIAADSATFGDLTSDLLNVAERVGHRLWFKKGDVVLDDGEFNDMMFIVGIGELGVLVNNEQVATLKKTDVFGEASAITGRTAEASIKVLSNQAFIIAARRDDLKNSLSPKVWERLSEISKQRDMQNVTYGFVKDTPAFSNASDHFHRACAKRMKLVTFKAGTEIVTLGLADTQGMFYIKSGEVSVHDRYCQIAALKENDFFGEMMLIGSGPDMKRSCSVRAVSAVEAYQLSKPAFLELATQFPDDVAGVKKTSRVRSRQALKKISTRQVA